MASFPATDRAAAVRFAVRSCALAVLYLYLRRSIDARRLTPATVACWLAPGLGLNGLLAIAQAVHQDPLGLTWLGEPQMLRSTRGTAIALVHGQPLLRAFGVLPHPNVLGGLLAAGLPLVLGACAHAEVPAWASRAREPRHGVAPRDALLLSPVLMAAGLVLSLSRSAWLGLLCGSLYLLCWRLAGRWQVARHTLRAGIAIGLVIVVLFAVEWDAIGARLQPSGNPLEELSIQQRLQLLDLSLKVIGGSPLIGVGGDNFARAAARFLPPGHSGATSPLPVHNTYLLAQAELGALGAATWLALMLTPLLGLALRVWARRTVPRASPADAPHYQRGNATTMQWQALTGCSLLVVAVTGIFDFYIWVNEPVAVLWIVALALFTVPAASSPAPTQLS